jgi:glycosyltransferase involved in cell wall biosynthesis
MAALKNIHYQRLVVGGWDLLEHWFLVFFSRRAKNALALESSIYESASFGLRGLIKRLFLSRIGVAFPSGEPHIALLKALNFSRPMHKTLGVGIFNYTYPKLIQKIFQGKFLYVGRLASEKNLTLLLDVFHQLPQYSLSVVGNGPLLAELNANKPANVTFLGHVPNEALSACYEQHDVFILPSIREPWGLVVEEALFHGLPVIASDRVGCAMDLIANNHAGVIFEAQNPQALREAILKVSQGFEALARDCQCVDFKAKDQHQVQQYLEAI